MDLSQMLALAAWAAIFARIALGVAGVECSASMIRPRGGVHSLGRARVADHHAGAR